MTKLLLDTNLLFYAVDHTSSFHRLSSRFIDEVESDLYTTSKNISEFLVSTTRGDSPTLTIAQVLDEVERFKKFLTILYPVQASLLELEKLLTHYQVRGKKIHDYEIAAIALTNNISQIATFNEQDFKEISRIEVINPAHYSFE